MRCSDHRRQYSLLLAISLLLAGGAAGCSTTSAHADGHRPTTASPAAPTSRTSPAATHPTPASPVGRIEHLLDPGGYLDGLTVAHGLLWAADLNGDRVVRVNPTTLHQLPDVAVPDGPLSLVADRGGVWVASYNGDRVSRLDAATGKTTATVTTRSAKPCGLAVVGSRLWIFDQSDGAGTLVDATSGAVLRKASTTALSGLAGYAFGSVWVTDFAGTSDAVQRLDPATGHRQLSVKTGQGPIMVAAGGGSMWVANANANTVTRFDPATGKIQAQVSLPGAAPVAVLITRGSAWVTGYSSNRLYRVDLATNAVVGSLPLPGPAQNMALAGGLLWVTMADGHLAGVAMAH